MGLEYLMASSTRRWPQDREGVRPTSIWGLRRALDGRDKSAQERIWAVHASSFLVAIQESNPGVSQEAATSIAETRGSVAQLAEWRALLPTDGLVTVAPRLKALDPRFRFGEPYDMGGTGSSLSLVVIPSGWILSLPDFIPKGSVHGDFTAMALFESGHGSYTKRASLRYRWAPQTGVTEALIW